MYKKIFFEYKQKVVLTLVEIPLPIVGQVIKSDTNILYVLKVLKGTQMLLYDIV